MTCLLGVLTTYLFEVRAGVWVAAVMLFVYVLINLMQASGVTRAFLALAMLLIATSGITALSITDIRNGFERMVFLGALLAALGLLRMVASSDGHVARAGRALSAQPPSRRYLSMSPGEHLFTTLLNMGGLGLLVVGKEVGSDTIFAGILRFLAIDVIVLFLIIAFPVISLLIPGTLS